MTDAQNWPFDQGANVAAISEAAVVEDGAPILLVAHSSDDHGWVFLSGRPFTTAQGKVIGMGTALQLDPSLRSIADLQPGWSATRAHLGAVWVRSVDPDV